jgi:Protein of unknown function (DUF1501)
MQDVVLVRSMSTKEGDHGRATYHLRTGYMPQGQIQYPALGALVAKERADETLDLPSFISIGPYRPLNPAAFGPGFLGQEYAPLVVGDAVPGRIPTAETYEAALKVQDLALPPGIDLKRSDARLGLLGGLNADFIAAHPGETPAGQRTSYARAVTLMRSASVKAFDLEGEPARLRDAYGRNGFGQGCLLARRLVERGVPFVEVTLSNLEGAGVLGWDTHQRNFDSVKRLSAVLDAGWSTLMDDLRSRGLLASTLIVWMGEFGRTPKINPNAGRDHFPKVFNVAVAGGGIKGGQVIGASSSDGSDVKDHPVTVPDLLASLCHSLKVDPAKEMMSPIGRPIKIVDGGKTVRALFS